MWVLAPVSAHAQHSPWPPLKPEEVFGHSSTTTKITPEGGGGWVPQFVSQPKSYQLYELKLHVKFQNPRSQDNPSGKKVTQGEEEERR